MFQQYSHVLHQLSQHRTKIFSDPQQSPALLLSSQEDPRRAVGFELRVTRVQEIQQLLHHPTDVISIDQGKTQLHCTSVEEDRRAGDRSEPCYLESVSQSETENERVFMAVPFNGDVQVFQTVHNGTPMPLNCVVVCLHRF